MESEIRMWMVISSNPVLVQGKEKSTEAVNIEQGQSNIHVHKKKPL